MRNIMPNTGDGNAGYIPTSYATVGGDYSSHTLCIGCRGPGIWVIEELKGYKNAPHTDEARLLVQSWLNANPVSCNAPKQEKVPE